MNWTTYLSLDDVFLALKENELRVDWYELNSLLKFIILGSSNLVPQKIKVIPPLQLFRVGAYTNEHLALFNKSNYQQNVSSNYVPIPL
jgi:hypothetical protein